MYGLLHSYGPYDFILPLYRAGDGATERVCHRALSDTGKTCTYAGCLQHHALTTTRHPDFTQKMRLLTPGPEAAVGKADNWPSP